MSTKSPVTHLYSAFCAVTLIFIVILMAGCLQNSAPAGTHVNVTPKGSGPIQAHYSPGEITRINATAIEQANASLNTIAAIPPGQRTFDNTLLAFDRVTTDYLDAVQPLILMGYVYPDTGISAEGMATDQATSIFITGTYSHRDLYDAMKGQVPRTTEESRLYLSLIHI